MYHNKGLAFRLLTPPVVNKGFVKNADNCNYEIYVTEILNQSKWFISRFHKPFLQSEDQSHGECDVYSGTYGLDYKLLASTTELLAHRVHSVQIAKTMDGMFRYYNKNPDEKPTTVTHVFYVVKNKSIDELEIYSASTTKQYGIEKDVKDFLRIMKTQKNLLLFFCFRFYFKGDMPDNALEIVRSFLQDCYQTSFMFRSKHCPEYDTYMITVLNNDFVLMQVKNNTLNIIDTVPKSKSPTFIELQNYCLWG